MYFPPQLGHLLDPCDNEFHATVHLQYWNIIDRYKKISMLEQIQAIHEAYFNVKESTARSYFTKCGMNSLESPAQVLNKLFHEGVYPAKKYRHLHQKQLESCIDWRWKSKKSINDIFGVPFEKLCPQKR
jgi:hypothetical protein